MDNATDSSLPLNETLVEETTENSVVVVVVSSGICFLIAAVGILGNAGVVWIIINYRSMRQADRKSTRLNSSHVRTSRMPSSA